MVNYVNHNKNKEVKSPQSNMRIYRTLHRIGLKRSYSFKFLFIAFIGTHIPLIGMVVYALLVPRESYDTTTTLTAILAYTLLAAIATLFILDKILAPIKLASRMVETYQESGRLLDVPKGFTDEAGRLLDQLDRFFAKMDVLTAERNNFTGLITHDVRNPIANIKGLALIMEDMVEDPSVLECIGMIDESCDSCLDIITDVSTLLRADDFSLNPTSMETIGVRDFMEEQVQKLKIPLGNKDINVVLDVATEDTMTVSPEFFSHIIQNLISNAIKFSHPKGEIEVSCSHGPDGYSISIRDQGIGFEPENSEGLFLRFTPLGREGTENEPTSGLGLFLTKMLVEKHKGRITAKSPGDGMGATFTVSLPAQMH